MSSISNPSATISLAAQISTERASAKLILRKERLPDEENPLSHYGLLA
jgi:hypothetical protein